VNIYRNLAFALTTVGVFFCVGCQSLTSSTAKGATAGPGAAETLLAHRGPEVEVVRNGMLSRYNSTTVGKAFEGTFQNPTWTSFETPKGATVVEFDGAISYGELNRGHFQPYIGKVQKEACHRSEGSDFDDAFMKCVAALTLPVKFQFALSADKKSFEIGYMSLEPFRLGADQFNDTWHQDPMSVLAFIYR
jgi:hypothetical protein